MADDRYFAGVWMDGWMGGWMDGLVAIKTKSYNFSLVFVSGISRPNLAPRPAPTSFEKWCRTNLILAPETNYKAISWPFPGLGEKSLNLKWQDDSRKENHVSKKCSDEYLDSEQETQIHMLVFLCF